MHRELPTASMSSAHVLLYSLNKIFALIVIFSQFIERFLVSELDIANGIIDCTHVQMTYSFEDIEDVRDESLNTAATVAAGDDYFSSFFTSFWHNHRR